MEAEDLWRHLASLGLSLWVGPDFGHNRGKWAAQIKPVNESHLEIVRGCASPGEAVREADRLARFFWPDLFSGVKRNVRE